MKRNLLLLALSSICSLGFAQQIVSVDKTTGRALASIPIWNIQQSDISVPVSVYYESGSGVTVGTDDYFLGLGWDLAAEGSVVRQLNGFPDDFAGTSGDERKGWLASYNSTIVADYIHGLSLNGDLNSRWNTLKTLYNANNEIILDSEPDVFTVSAPGLSAQFVFDRNGNPQSFPYSDVKIEAVGAGTGPISQFTITNSDGTQYYFKRRISVTRQTTDLDALADEEFFKNEFDAFSTPITYTSEWKLTWIRSYLHGTVGFSYGDLSPVYEDTDIEVYLKRGGAAGFEKKSVYRINTDYTPLFLSSIWNSDGQKIEFDVDATSRRLDRIDISDDRRGDNSLVKSFDFSYESVASGITSGSIQYLTSIHETSGCDLLPPYKFSYESKEDFPGEFTNSIDYWGYFNGRNNITDFPKLDIYPNETQGKDRIQLYRDYTVSGKTKYTLSGADRRPNSSVAAHGILKSIQLPLGDQVTINYEGNEYLDPFSQQVVEGPGVRVKSLNRFGKRINALANELIHYHYTADISNPSTGATSGTLTYDPSFAILTKNYRNGLAQIPYTTLDGSGYTDLEKWQHLTARTNKSIGQGGQLYYSTLIEEKLGDSGFSVTKSKLPPGTSAVDPLWSDWSETATSLGQSTGTSCQIAGLIGTGNGVYPYNPATASGAEYVMPVEEIVYDASLNKLVENKSNYVKVNLAPAATRGIKLETVPNGCSDMEFVFGSYELKNNIQYLLGSSQSIHYEHDGVVNHSMASTTTYAHGAANHMYPTSIETLDAEGNRFKNEMIYPVDYQLSGTANGTDANAIEKLVIDHRIASPVESISSQQLVGETSFGVVGGSYTTFKKINEKVVLKEAKSFQTKLTVSNFSTSNSSPGSLSPDSRYETDVVFTAYDAQYRLTESYSPRSRNTSATLWSASTGAPTLQVSRADAAAVFYNNFTSQYPENSIIVAGGGSIPFASGRNDAKSLELSQGPKVVGTFTPQGNDYVLSFWHQVNGSETVRLQLRPEQTQPITNTIDIPITGNGTWRHHSYRVDLGTLTNGVHFTLIALHSGGTIYLDDLLFYPEEASVSSQIFDFPYGVTSSTDHVAGISATQLYDGLGRQTITLDNEGNVRRIQKYEYADLPPVLFTSYIHSSTSQAFENESLNFLAKEVCLEGVTYEWAFMDDGVVPQELDYQDLGLITSHTFTTTGVKDVYLRIKKTGYSTFNAGVRSVLVKEEILNISSCHKGMLGVDKCGYYQTLPMECGSISGTPSNDFEVLFGPDEVSGGDGNYTYQWQKRMINSNTWANVTTPSNGQIAICQTDDYEVRLLVTDGLGRTGESQSTQVAHYQSDPQCQVNLSTCN